MVVLTPEQLKETLDFWLPYFGLSDWDVRIEMVSCANMEPALARSCTRIYSRELDIEIGSYETRNVRSQARCDMEVDLVHEIMHCPLNPLMRLAESMDGGVLEDLALEQPVEMLARSMVRLRRLSGPRFSWEQAAQAGRLDAEKGRL